MPKFEIAVISEPETDFIVVLLESGFGAASEAEQEAFIEDIQQRVEESGYAGVVVAAWDKGHAMGFVVPDEWSDVFGRISPDDILENISGELSW